MGQTAIQATISVALQIVLTGIVGYAVHRLTVARNEFRSFMAEHKFLLENAAANTEAIIKLNKRMDRAERRRGQVL